MRRSSSDSSVESQSHVTTRPTKKTRPSPIQTDGIVTTDAHRFKVKVPPFSPDEPEIWFALLEGQFTQYGIQDDAVRYTHVITNLDILHAKAVKDIIVNPPERHRYGKIKTELIRRLSDSHERKIKQLLTHEELGDRKPSQFLRHLKDLAGPSVPNDLQERFGVSASRATCRRCWLLSQRFRPSSLPTSRTTYWRSSHLLTLR